MNSNAQGSIPLYTASAASLSPLNRTSENSVSTIPKGYQHKWVVLCAKRTGLDLDHPNRRTDQFSQHGVRERHDGVLGSAVDCSTGVGLASRDRAEVDDHLGGCSSASIVATVWRKENSRLNSVS